MWMAPEPLEAELPSLADAKCEAVRSAGEMICDSANEFWDTGGFKMTVSDENGLILFVVQFSAIEAPAQLDRRLS